MNVSLTPELEKLVQEKVESGRYTSASEVVREALRLMEKRDRRMEEREEALKEFQAMIDGRIAEADAGMVMDVEDAFARIRAKSAARRKKSA
ncbi:MAG: type II toxin-antitoxin system ParD family antitoxin [Acidobacteriaceae bacterium]